jgi:secretion/DNA translocation related TadE-like protein
VRAEGEARVGGRQLGSAGLWAVTVVAVLLAVTVGALTWSGALAARQRAESTSDMAALAGARSLALGTDGCAAAARVTAASGGRLAACVVDGSSVSVLVEVTLSSGLPVRLDMAPARARARAGAIVGGLR